MSRPSRSAPFLVAGLWLVFGAYVVSAQDKPKAPARRASKTLKVGVVDIGVLFKSYKRKDTLEEEINKKREEITGELKKKAEKIQEMRKRIEKSQLREGSEPWMRAMRDIELEQYRLKLEKDHLQNSLKKEVERHTLKILNELRKTIARYGSHYKYDLILKIDNEGRGDGDEDTVGSEARVL